MDVVWTDYMRYRASVRGFDIVKLDRIVQNSTERYYDTATLRLVVVGHHDSRLVLIPYEQQGDVIVPVTVHVTTRQQINLRLRTGRFRYE